MKLCSYVGGHPVRLYADAVYDPAIRKYRGGRIVATIPYSGRMLSATALPQTEQLLSLNGAAVPVRSPQRWQTVDPLPPAEECDFALVSAQYAAACRALGLDTSRLLTIGGVVVDEAGRTVGAAWLNRN